MVTQNNQNSTAIDTDVTSKIDEALDDIRKAISSFESDSEDALELTEIMEVPAKPKADPTEESESDILKTIDNSVAANKYKNMFGELNAEENKTPVEQAIGSKSQKTNEALLAKNVVEETKALFKSVMDSSSKEKITSLNFRTGTTLEDLVIELLKPEINEWLNKNLPAIVKTVVEKEIKKLVPQDE